MSANCICHKVWKETSNPNNKQAILIIVSYKEHCFLIQELPGSLVVALYKRTKNTGNQARTKYWNIGNIRHVWGGKKSEEGKIRYFKLAVTHTFLKVFFILHVLFLFGGFVGPPKSKCKLTSSSIPLSVSSNIEYGD